MADKTAKDLLESGARRLNSLFENITSEKTVIEVEPEEISKFIKAREVHLRERPNTKIEIKYDLETKSLEIIASKTELFYYGFYFGHVEK